MTFSHPLQQCLEWTPLIQIGIHDTENAISVTHIHTLACLSHILSEPCIHSSSNSSSSNCRSSSNSSRSISSISGNSSSVISASDDRYQDCYDEVEYSEVRDHESPSLGLRRGVYAYIRDNNKQYIYIFD